MEWQPPTYEEVLEKTANFYMERLGEGQSPEQARVFRFEHTVHARWALEACELLKSKGLMEGGEVDVHHEQQWSSIEYKLTIEGVKAIEEYVGGKQ